MGYLSNSISLQYIVPFMPLLNYSINSFPSYSLSLITLLNFCINFSIIFPSCSNFLNSTTFTVFLFPSSNSFFISVKNFSAISYSNTLTSKSSNTFSFHTSANPSCTYNKIHYICSFTASSLIFILIYSLYTIMNSDNFSKLLLNTYSLATSVFDSVLGLGTASSILSAANNAWICTYIAAS